MMTEKFKIVRVWDDQAFYFEIDGKRMTNEEVVDKLNEQQEHITHLEDTNDNFQIKLIEDIEAMEQAEKKIGEQQATIEQLNLAIDDLLSHTSCDEIKKENEQLRNSMEKLKNVNLVIELRYNYGYEKYLADVRVIDDE